MSDWAPKRFWTNAEVVDADDGFTVQLDGKGVRTPAKASLVVPTRTMADHIAAEWQAQTDKIDPLTMPWTRSANAAVDKISAARGDIEAHLIDYAGTDLLCYRATGPESLIEAQAYAWNPIVEWSAQKFDAPMVTTQGVMPVAQSEAAIGNLHQAMGPMNDFELTGFYDLVTISGSYMIALAVTEGIESPESLWVRSRTDEIWQIEQWGADEEAEEEAETKKLAFLHATAFYKTARNS